MKNRKSLLASRIKFFALAILSLIALVLIATNPVVGSGVVISMAIIVGGVELTGKEEALYVALTEHINKETEKFGKGYISEQKMLDTIAAKIKEFNLKIEDTDEFKKIQDALTKQGLELVALKENGLPGNSKITTVKDAVAQGFSNPDIKTKTLEIVSRKSGMTEIVTIKAVGNITTGNVTTTTGGIALLDLINSAERSIARLAETFIERFATVMSTSTPIVTYADYLPKEGDVGFVAEGGTKPQVDGKIEVRYATPKKAAGYEILTTEAVQDIPQMQSFASTLLFKKYLLKRQYAIIFGDGIGENPLGVTKVAAVFDPASWTGEKIYVPNLLDAIRAVANQIYTTQSWTDDVAYLPNVAYINPADWFAFIGTKTTEGMYVFPQLTFGDSNSIDNFTVIPNVKVPAGKILMGDFSKLIIVDYIPYSVSQGWINDQFIKNQLTIVGEGRFFTYVKKYDERAFIYDDLANVIAGIEKV